MKDESYQAEAERLRAAISKHRSQKADDRCIEDDDELYAALRDGIPCDRRVGDMIAMLNNCARFIIRRCEGGGWPSYAELEQRIAGLEPLVYVGNSYHCPECGFTVTKMLLSAVDGSVGADTSIVKEFCENDGAELERTTWKKAAADMGELAQGQHDYIMELKSKERVM